MGKLTLDDSKVLSHSLFLYQIIGCLRMLNGLSIGIVQVCV